jgi:hypothetical protein
MQGVAPGPVPLFALSCLAAVLSCNGSVSGGPAADAMVEGDSSAPPGEAGAADIPVSDGREEDGGAPEASVLSWLVCGGEPTDCPPVAPSLPACSKNGLCCVYQPAPPGVVGCTCRQGTWYCGFQVCGCGGESDAGCGTPGNPCCADNSCAGGGCCYGGRCFAPGSVCGPLLADFGGCMDGKCGGCGGPDQPCCGGTCRVGPCLDGRCKTAP